MNVFIHEYISKPTKRKKQSKKRGQLYKTETMVAWSDSCVIDHVNENFMLHRCREVIQPDKGLQCKIYMYTDIPLVTDELKIDATTI